jgi:hypothetical protein
MARRVLVRYQVKPERIQEHEGLIRDVMAELAQTAPAGIRYGAFKQPDGVSFVHVAVIDADKSPLDSSPAFRAFTDRIKERIVAPPDVVELTPVGAFGF